jgi:uncharacterized protein (UPF0332 family)
MTPYEIQVLLNRADESHEAAQVLLKGSFWNFSAAQSYYTMFYLMEALLHSKGLEFSSHSAVIAAFGREFSKTKILDPKFHNHIIVTQRRRETGHYGVENVITQEEAIESFEWADEFIQVVKGYFERQE